MRGKPPIIAITMGDPCGIGPEVTAKTIARYRDASESCVLLLIGDYTVWRDTLDALGLVVDYIRTNDVTSLEEDILPGVAYFYDLSNHGQFAPGKLSGASGAAAMRYLERAVDLALSGEINAIVTAPISKEHINNAGYPFAGHTDYFRHRAGGTEPTMCFYSREFTVALVCDHVPLREVHRYVTDKRIYDTITRTDGFFKALGIASPRIGVMGLNPHCGEDGLLGDEEISEIIPAISKTSENGLDIVGPLTPEAAFLKAMDGGLDGIVAMYHDQGIAPLKIITGIDSVNVSLGLPFVRTSVSHGTAVDIAGKGIADETSMVMALDLAVRLT